ncbi:MAG: winged-helix domain-containing protein [Candidatus Aenigmarchaeota archaeon]|nr:winged-helix domain-containing protein [Candidatus Aenigmarchaeota archaeon]
MMNANSLINISVEKDTKVQKEDLESVVLGLAERLDFIDIQILRKFYMTGKEFPNDTQPYCFPLLFKEMKESHHLKIGIEAMRKRLKNLERVGLIQKVKYSNPTSYTPVRGLEQVVRAVITRFFLINGLTKFL